MKKFSIVLLALALMVTMAMPAMAEANFDHYFEVVNNNYDNDTEDVTAGWYYLYVYGDISEDISYYSEIDFDYSFDQDDNSDNDVDFFEGWIDADNVVGPVGLKIGRMQQYSGGVGGNPKIGSQQALYAFDTDEFGVLNYEQNNVAVKFGHSVDNDKRMFAEAKATDLGVLDEAALNYVDDDVDTNDYNGYTLKLAKQFNPVKVDFVYGDASNENNTNDLDADLINFRVSSDQLISGANIGLEYADIEEGYANKEILDEEEGNILKTRFDQDPNTPDTNEAIVSSFGEDVELIKPSVNFDVTDKLNIGFAYKMYEFQDTDEELDVAHLYSTYDLKENLLLEVEVWDQSSDVLAGDNTSLL